MEISKELAEALIHQGPCRAARELHIETVVLASKGVCPYYDLVRLFEIERGCRECIEFESQADEEGDNETAIADGPGTIQRIN